MGKIRLAMIGAGTHSTNALYPSLNFIDNIERVAVCDIKEGLAKEIAVKFGFSKNYTDYRKMLETENIDGVIICINAKEHPAITKECLKQGVDVFVEKPAAISPVECKDVAVNPDIQCGKCYDCRNNFGYTWCDNIKSYGHLACLACDTPPYLTGGWAEYMYVFPGSYERVF